MVFQGESGSSVSSVTASRVRSDDGLVQSMSAAANESLLTVNSNEPELARKSTVSDRQTEKEKEREMMDQREQKASGQNRRRINAHVFSTMP